MVALDDSFLRVFFIEKVTNGEHFGGRSLGVDPAGTASGPNWIPEVQPPSPEMMIFRLDCYMEAGRISATFRHCTAYPNALFAC